MECERCGGDKWLITSAGILDDIRNALGDVLFKCTRCGRRRRERVWPTSHCILAHCPRCYSQHLQVWNRAFLRRSMRQALVFVLGGDAYRCYECQNVFVSLRPRRLFRRIGRPDEEAAPPSGMAEGEPDVNLQAKG